MKRLSNILSCKRLPESPPQKHTTCTSMILKKKISDRTPKSASTIQIDKIDINKFFSQLDSQEELTLKFKKAYFKDLKTQKSNIVYEVYPNNDIYEGQKNSFGKKQGYGIQWFSSGDCYMGQFLNGKPEGYGIYIFDNGSRYVGQFKKGNKHGMGKAYSQIGLYSGQFKNGKKNGYGDYFYINKNTYLGNWKDDKFHGKGVIQVPRSYIYTGSLQQNNRHGSGQILFTNQIVFDGSFDKNEIFYGTMTYPDGSKYQGEWFNFQKSGKGLIVYSNGDKYSGDFMNDTFNGFGQYSYSNGDLYTGNFKNGLLHDQGTYIYDCGTSFKGEWKNGIRTEKGLWIGLQNFNSKCQQLCDSIFIKNKIQKKQQVAQKLCLRIEDYIQSQQLADQSSSSESIINPEINKSLDQPKQDKQCPDHPNEVSYFEQQLSKYSSPV